MQFASATILPCFSCKTGGFLDPARLPKTVFTCVASAICYLIIPATNRASDIGDKKKFDLLHKVSVYSTVLMLVGNIAYLFV